MIKGLYTSAAGMLPRITQQESIASNLANSSTTGYKKSEVFLRSLIDASYAFDRALGRENTNEPEEVWVDYEQGTFDETGNAFDLAINGDGFFRVSGSDGAVWYTRNGQFHLNTGGVLVNAAGMSLLDDQNKPITIEGNAVAIMGNGVVLVDGAEVAQIGVAGFDANGYRSLESVGMGLFRKPASTNETAVGAGTTVLQGCLEDSNAEPVRAMVDMIDALRSFEAGQKAIHIQDQSLQRVVNELGTVR